MESRESRELPAVKRILAQVEPEKIIRIICESLKVEKEELLRKGYKGVGRGVLMEMLYRHGGMKQKEIGGLMGIDYSAMSVMRKRLEGLQGRDQRLSALIERLEKRLRSSQE
jgi:predicted transcriptional regulator